jgi:chaperone modulatory protein CbpM
MMSDHSYPDTPLTGETDWAGCSLTELCQRLPLHQHFVVECVEHGVVHVPGQRPLEWVFTSTEIVRIQKAHRLHRDLDIQISNLALVLDLLDQRDALEQEVIALRGRLSWWE